jgi:hypothetical protein
MLERDLGFALQMGLNPLIKTWALDKTPFEAVRTTMLHPDVAHTHTQTGNKERKKQCIEMII